MGEDFISEGSLGGVVAFGGSVVACWVIGEVDDEGALFVHPFESTAIHDAAVGVSEELEHPEGVACPPIVFVTIKNDVRIIRSTEARHEGFEARFVKIVADKLIIEVERPIDFVSAGDVT